MSQNTSLLNESIQDSISKMAADKSFKNLSTAWICEASRLKYFHNLTWLGRPIIQAPQDSYAVQELVCSIRPDLIIETGIAHGGSLVLSASMLALLDYCDAAEQGLALDPRESQRRVLGIDIEIRPHNREAIEAHPMAHLIKMIEGSSVDPDVIHKAETMARGYEKVLVFLDSNHTHAHVLAELKAYAPLVSVGSYCVVWDTGIEDLPENSCSDRPWGKGNNPRTAVYEYLKNTNCFEIDELIHHKLMITAAPDGFLRRVK